MDTWNNTSDRSINRYFNTIAEQSEPVTPLVQDLTSKDNIISAALKEWAVVCNALEDGRQVLLFRKGGIMEYRQGFQMRHNTFFLYPTFEHQSRDFIQSDYVERLEMIMNAQPTEGKNTITSYARSVTVKQITDTSLLSSLRRYHIWNDNYVIQRMNYNPKKPLSAVLLRVYKIDPIEVDVRSEWIGCKSWIPIDSIPAQLHSKNLLKGHNKSSSKYQGNHDNYYDNIGTNVHPVIEELRFEKIVDEIEEILE
jgi:hypothetical protein